MLIIKICFLIGYAPEMTGKQGSKNGDINP